MKKTVLILILMVASGPLYAQTITIGDDNIVRCKGVSIGTKQTIDDIEYEVVDRARLIAIRNGAGDLTKVCVSNVTDMSTLFQSSQFNQPIGNWDVSMVTDMVAMFERTPFNQDISAWDVSSVTDMSFMFRRSSFDQPLGDWVVSSVTNMSNMFNISQFNQAIGNWDVSSVKDMIAMFRDSPFNQPINSWCVSQISSEPLNFSRDLSDINKPIWGGCLVISNLPNTVDGGSTITDVGWKAMLFTTGSSPRQLASVVVGLNHNPTSESMPFTQKVKVSLFSVSGGNPHTELLTTGLVSVTMPARQGVYTFLDASSFTMAPNTQYALVLSSDASTIKWGANGVSSTTPTASAGLTYNSFRQSSDAGGNWTTTKSTASNNAFAIRMVPIPLAPVISPDGGTFVGSTTVELSAQVGAQIYYTLDGSAPTTTDSPLYAGPFAVGESGTVRALAFANGEVSPITTAEFEITAGAVSATTSTVVASPATNVVADGVATSTITVTLRDANNNPVPGKTVSLAATNNGIKSKSWGLS